MTDTSTANRDEEIRAEADRVMDRIFGPGWKMFHAGTQLRTDMEADRDRIFSALLSQRQRGEADGLERAAEWHDRERAHLQSACDAAWVEYTPDLGLHAIKVHEESAKAIRSLQPEQKDEGR